MMFKNILIIFVSLIIGGIGGYFLNSDKNIQDIIWSIGSEDGYYRIDNIAYSNDTMDGFRYCKMIEENKIELPDTLGSYIKLGNDIIYQGNKVTTCTDCKVNADISFLLFDGTNTFYQGKQLSGFNYSNITILSQSDMVFTDQHNVYYQGNLLEGMDWKSFEQPNKGLSVYQDKNYIYTIKPGKIIERVSKNGENNDTISE